MGRVSLVGQKLSGIGQCANCPGFVLFTRIMRRVERQASLTKFRSVSLGRCSSWITTPLRTFWLIDSNACNKLLWLGTAYERPVGGCITKLDSYVKQMFIATSLPLNSYLDFNNYIELQNYRILEALNHSASLSYHNLSSSRR